MSDGRNLHDFALLSVNFRCLDWNDSGSRIQTSQIVRFARDYRIPSLPCKDNDGRVDNIRSVGRAAEFSTGTGKLSVKGSNFDFLTPKGPCQCNLKTTIPPSLSQDARRHSKNAPLHQRLREQGDHALITAIQVHQRAGIQCYPRRCGARALFAHLVSSAPGWPCCSIKSRSNTRRDSRSSCSASARAM